MLREFIDFVESILSAVSPDTKNAAKEAIAQFEGKGSNKNGKIIGIYQRENPIR